METGSMMDSIHRMTNEIAGALEGSLYCIWLYGSVVFGDFRMGWSDIDFVALTDRPITEKQANKLLTLRQTLSEGEPENLYYRAFEGIIADIHEYSRNSYSKLVYWGTSGQRITDAYANDVFSQLELSKYGRSVYGTADRSIFSEPCREDIVKAVQAHYEAIRKYACQTDARLYSCGWLLDIARCIYTLRNNDVIAKTQAGILGVGESYISE